MANKYQRPTALGGLAIIIIELLSSSGTDAASFLLPKTFGVSSEVGKTATLKWEYKVEQGEVLNAIRCGYRDKTTIALVVKQGHKKAQVATESANFPKSYIGRVQAYDVGNTIGIIINKLVKGDQKNYRCSIFYSPSVVPLFSHELKLSLPVSPRFIQCLEDIPRYIETGESIKVSCSAYGDPQPILTCRAFRKDGSIFATVGGMNANITKKTIAKIGREVSGVVCAARNSHKAVEKKIALAVGYGIPSKVRNVRLVSITSSAIHIAWDPPADNGGLPIKYYYITIQWKDSLKWSDSVPPDKLFYKYKGFKPNTTYVLEVAAVNKVGKGASSGSRYKTPKEQKGHGVNYAGSNANIAAALGVPLIIVFVAAIVGCIVYYQRCTGETQQNNNEHNNEPSFSNQIGDPDPTAITNAGDPVVNTPTQDREFTPGNQQDENEKEETEVALEMVVVEVLKSEGEGNTMDTED